MMREIEQLLRQLTLVTSDALKSWHLENSALNSAHEHAVGLLGHKVTTRVPVAEFEEQIRKALALFKDKGESIDFRTLRLACYGATTPMSGEALPLIADNPAFERLLQEVTSYLRDTRRFRRLFAGLLSAYFTLERNSHSFSLDSVQAGNESLRSYLSRMLDHCSAEGQNLEWIDALTAYPNVLSNNPGRRFATAFLENDTSEFENVIRRLGIPGTSWLVTEVFRAAVSEASSNSDREFAQHMTTLLKTLEEPRYIAVRDETLARLLLRYSAIPHPPVHAQLRDALVTAWKNPWLTRNEAAWGRVTPAARQMVSSWLKLELIHQFFEVLSEEGRQDKSRFEFWRSFHDRMDDAYFALGASAFHSGSDDLKKLRTALEGRLFELVGGQSDTHAIIMKFGDVIVVEFSQKGNAAYTYSSANFSLPEGTMRLPLGHLRQDTENRLIHRSAGGMSWQERFTLALHPLERSQASKPAPTTMMGADVARLARLKGLSVEDNRSKGGNLRIEGSVDAEFAEQLAQWGFKFKAGRGWWRSE